MPKKKSPAKPEWVDPDDAPELTDEYFEHADIHIGGKLIRRGRPKPHSPKELVSLRLDADVLEHLRASDPGWELRVNDTLRKSLGL